MIDVALTAAVNPVTAGFYSQPAKADGQLATLTNSTGISYPEPWTDGGTDTTERPAWRAYWAAIYQYYTVLGCEYKITMINPVTTEGAKAIVGTQFDSYTTAAAATGNVMPLANLSEAMAFKNLRWDIIDRDSASQPNKNVCVISGRYKPGQTKRNIVNDGDVKTWSSTGTFDQIGLGTGDDGVNPTLNEILTLNFWRAPLGYSTAVALNMQIELKYIVQFKDLRSQARYPTTIGGDILVQTLGTSGTARGNALQRWKP